MRPTKSSQDKLQAILKTQGYSIRYERGNFQGGYCVVHDQKTIVINKFHPIEGKVNTLMDIVRDLPMDEEQLSDEQKKLVDQLKHSK